MYVPNAVVPVIAEFAGGGPLLDWRSLTCRIQIPTASGCRACLRAGSLLIVPLRFIGDVK